VANDITNQQLLEALTDQLGVITDQMVTKTDLKRELKRFSTKKDLKRLEAKLAATQSDLEAKLADTKADLGAKNGLQQLEQSLGKATIRLERSIKSSHTVNIRHHLETRDMLGNPNHKFDNLRQGLAQAAKPA